VGSRVKTFIVTMTGCVLLSNLNDCKNIIRFYFLLIVSQTHLVSWRICDNVILLKDEEDKVIEKF